MARTNTTRYAILGMLTLRPMSGYDLKREVEKSIAHFWSESYGQVYPVLRDLAREGLASVHVEPGEGRPDRKVYTITDAGREALRAWLRRPVEPQPDRNELLLKLFFGRNVSDADLARLVRDFRDGWARGLEEWQAVANRIRADRDPDDPDRRDRLFTLRYGELVAPAMIAWADELLAELDATGEEDALAPSSRAAT